nr:hypothetical 22.3K protein - Selenomonas ruminantium plasmid pJDB23 [Selenomonas ruminantium]
MTFLELQNQIVQTRKARKGIKNREDYFQDDETEEFWTSVYKRALYIANEVVKHYEKKGAYDSSEKFHLSWGEAPNDYFDDYIKQMKAYEKEVKDYQKLWKEHSELFDGKLKSDKEIAQLKRELSAAKAELVRVKRGEDTKIMRKSIKWSIIKKRIHQQLFERLPRLWGFLQQQFRKHWWQMV